MHYSISLVARRFGLRVSALRYYDRIGLLKPVVRKGNVRYYDRDRLRRLAFIERLHRQGMVSLADTATLLADQPADDAKREVLASAAQTLDERIEHLRAARRTLAHLLECPGPISECPYLNDEFEAAVTTALG